jgi:hypothetical protein
MPPIAHVVISKSATYKLSEEVFKIIEEGIETFKLL